MSEPLYVPVLPVKPHAAKAFAGLSPADQRYAAPLWTLPPQEPGPLGKLPESAFRDMARSRRFSDGAWLDLPFVQAVTSKTEERLRLLWTVGAFTPVTAPHRSARLHELAVGCARSPLGGGRIGIRVSVPGSWRDEQAVEAENLIAGMAVPAAPGQVPTTMDLLLDLGAVLEPRSEAGKEALLALDALVPLAPWRCIAVLAGASAKQPVKELHMGGRDFGVRHDWALWRGIRDAGRAYGSRVRYGDYGALPASDVGSGQRKSGGPAAWGSMRYTTEDDFLYTKFRTFGQGLRDSVRAAARKILAGNGYRGRADGWSHEWLTECADGTGGIGNAATWNRVSNHQHLTFVIRSLTG